MAKYREKLYENANENQKREVKARPGGAFQESPARMNVLFSLKPRHERTQFLADFFNRMGALNTAGGLEVWVTRLIFQNKIAGKDAFLNF